MLILEVQNALAPSKMVWTNQNKLDLSKTNWTYQNRFGPLEGKGICHQKFKIHMRIQNEFIRHCDMST